MVDVNGSYGLLAQMPGRLARLLSLTVFRFHAGWSRPDPRLVAGIHRLKESMRVGMPNLRASVERQFDAEVQKRYGRNVGTRTPDLYRVKGNRTSFTTTYMATGDCQVPAKTCKTEQSWVELMGPNRLQISACRVLLYWSQSLRDALRKSHGLLSRDA